MPKPEPNHAAGLDDLAGALKDRPGSLDLFGLPGSAAAYILAQAGSKPENLLVITPSQAQAETLVDDLRFFLGSKNTGQVRLFPAYAHLPFGHVPAHPFTVGRRIKALWSMIGGEGRRITVAPIQAAMFRVMPRTVLNRFSDLLLEGEEVDRDDLLEKLVAGGYRPTALVEEPGDMAIRGGIVDIFGPFDDDPVRLEFFGDFVDSLRLFKPHDQRSVRRLQESILLPMSEVLLDQENLDRGRRRLARIAADPAKILELREPLTTGRGFSGIEYFLPLFYDSTDTLWDYLDNSEQLCIIDPAGVEQAARDHMAVLREHQANLRATDQPCLPVDEIALEWDRIEASLKSRARLRIRPLEVMDEEPRINFNGRSAQRYFTESEKKPETVLSPLVKVVRELNDRGLTPFLVCRTEGQIKRLMELLEGYGLTLFQDSQPPGRGRPRAADLILIHGALSSGFELPAQNLVVMTEEEALGQARVRSGRHRPSVPTARLASFAELNPNDLVVHVDHGIGRFVSLTNLSVGGKMGDFLLLEYKSSDKLYVPADRLSVIQKYSGPEGKSPPLDRLGGQTWTKAKSRVKKKLIEIVKELVDLYAVRQVRDGFAFSGRDELFTEFEATFEFDETRDQAKAIEDVLDDMVEPRPMDRLICGDVGYGKTEVALRAVFRAVLDGKQVGVLVPTTVLAEQHGQTFIQRLKGFPVRVEVLSRFKSQKAQKEILKDTEKGLVDVVVGTHRLLSKDVIFPNLGLVIIDEEHRFGVNHKERLKELRKTVDVLAMTATPIPRTLQMSLLEIRDLSVINTPPPDRQSITTYLSKFDPAVIQEAIGRELARDGQVYFVHNRVRDIVKVANLIQKLVPTARLEVAHGQMSERVLEEVMLKFFRGEIDVLVCTTIIESGLDVPSANTIIINHADKLGLAQIYQLRGRVGRSAAQAFAYLLIPSETTLTPDAQKRLKVMMDYSHLGAGFQIAMHDLRIRGGGNLLGRAQSGNITQVGYEMYLTLMEQAIAELKGEKVQERLEPELSLPYSAYIPAEYVDDPNQRLVIYRRFSAVDDERDLEELINELIDRFGPLGEEVENLARTIRLKLKLRRVGVGKVDVSTKQASLTFDPSTPIEPQAMIKLVRSNPKVYKLTPDQSLVITNKNPLAETEKVVAGLLKGV